MCGLLACTVYAGLQPPVYPPWSLCTASCSRSRQMNVGYTFGCGRKLLARIRSGAVGKFLGKLRVKWKCGGGGRAPRGRAGSFT